jgi:hypothetical protein
MVNSEQVMFLYAYFACIFFFQASKTHITSHLVLAMAHTNSEIHSFMLLVFMLIVVEMKLTAS